MHATVVATCRLNMRPGCSHELPTGGNRNVFFVVRPHGGRGNQHDMHPPRAHYPAHQSYLRGNDPSEH